MKRFLAPVLLLAGLGLAQETGYTTAWSGHKTLNLNTSFTGANVSRNVLKFPVLVRLTLADSATFRVAKSGGADLRFTKSNGTTRLKHEIESWDSTHASASIWVLADTVYGNNSAQSIRMHWGNAAAADSSNGKAVFDSTNGFVGVWHMGNPVGGVAQTGIRPNSAGSRNNATPVNLTATPIRNGMIGMADSVPGTGTMAGTAANEASGFRLDTLPAGTFANGTVTFSAWMQQALTGSNWRSAVSAGNPGACCAASTNSILVGTAGTGTQRIGYQVATYPGGDANPTWPSSPNNAYAINTWFNVAVTVRPGYGNDTLFLNGVPVAPIIGTEDRDIKDTIRTLNSIARNIFTTDTPLRGMVDEVRMANVARSNDWVKLDYANQNASQSLVSAATVATLAYTADSVSLEASFVISAIAPATVTGTPSPTFTISPALPTGLALSATTGVISGTPAAASTKTKYIVTATNTAGTVTDSIWITVNAASVVEDYSTWTGTKTVNFTSATAAARFPLLVRLGAGDSAVFSAGRNSLRFSKTDGSKLRYEIDTWDSTGRAAAVWVLLDNVIAGSNSVRMHWGKAAATNQSNANSVFEASNGYVGVWHLGNAAGIDPRPNAVAGGPAATPSSDSVGIQFGGGAGTYVIPNGAIGKADTLRSGGTRNAPTATSDYLNLGNAAGSTVAPFSGNNTFTGYNSFPNGFSYSVWVYPTGTVANTYMLSLSNAGSAAKDNIQVFRPTGTSPSVIRYEDHLLLTSNGTVSSPTASTSLVNSVWQKMVVSMDASRKITFSRNGVVLMADAQALGSIRDTVRMNAWMGKSPYTGDSYFRGSFDDARISNVTRSNDWNLLEYQTQAPGVMPVSLAYTAPTNLVPGAPITAITPATSGAVKFKVSPALPAGLSIDSVTGVISGTPTATTSSATYTVTATNGPWSATSTVAFSVAAGDGAYATAWSGHKYISVNTATAGIPAGVTLKFPLLVTLGTADSAIFNASQTTGADVRFTKLNNTTRVPHEIESWDATNKRAAIWVLLDSVVGSTTGSRLAMHYGNATVGDSSKSSAVFDTANGFLAVYHLGNPAGAAQTAVRPNSALPGTNDATPSQFPSNYTVPTGLIGMADTLRGQGRGTGTLGDHLNLGTGFSNFGNSTATMSMWFKPSGLGTTNFIQFMSLGNTVGGNGSETFWMGKYGDATNTFSTEALSGTTSGARNNSGTLTVGAWQLLAVTLNGANANEHINYVNGAAQTIQNSTSALQNVSRSANYIGRSNWTGDSTARGVMDEVRISKTVRSATWFKLEYANQNAAQNLVAITNSPVAIVVGINNASASTLGAPSLGFKALGQGLLFQVESPASSKVRLAIVDMFGRTVWNNTVATTAGMNQISWNGTANNGQGISAGIYVVRMNLLDAKGKSVSSLNRKVPLTH